MVRRLIIVAVEEGKELEIDYDGEFAYWEVESALQRASDLVAADSLDADILKEVEVEDEEGDTL